jgi:hypothetical protein
MAGKVLCPGNYYMIRCTGKNQRTNYYMHKPGVFVFYRREAASYVKALRKRDARNVQALRLAHVSAGKGVGADRLRPIFGWRKLHPRGNRIRFPHQKL